MSNEKATKKHAGHKNNGIPSVQELSAYTPRQQKSVSVLNETSSKYMHLQLQVSNKKRESQQRIISQQLQRISQLQQQVRQNQQFAMEIIQKGKQYEKREHQDKIMYNRLKENFQSMKEKCSRLQGKIKAMAQVQRENIQVKRQNIRLKQENQLIKRQNSEWERKYQELKSLRKKQKLQWKALIPEFIEEVNRLKIQFLKLQSTQ